MDGYPVVVRFPLHWGEMDALGHVNNARYFTWFESARMALFEQVGLETAGTPTIGPILAHTSCDFLAPLHHPAEVLAGTRIERLGTSSFAMGYAVARADEPNRPVASGKGVLVLIDYTTGAKVPIPDDLRAALSALGPEGG